MKPITFTKYDEMGAYHWVQCDRTAPNYNPPLEARYKVLIKRIGKVERILDIGCGDGYLLSQMSSNCQKAIGIDSETSGIALAKEKLRQFPNCEVSQASCYDIPLADSSFDLVTLADVFEHLEYPERCLSEISRLLNQTGRLLLTTPKWRPDRMWDHVHVKEYTPTELTEHLTKYFDQVELSFFWPMSWYNKYATRFGSKAIRFMSRHLPNPYEQEGLDADRFGQMLAVCSKPRTLVVEQKRNK